jgi:hypothetical protein
MIGKSVILNLLSQPLSDESLSESFFILSERPNFCWVSTKANVQSRDQLSIPYGIDIDQPIREWCRHAGTSFPSGHAAIFFGLSFGLTYISWSMGVLCLIYSFIIALSRIFFGIHYPTDIIAGAFIGVSIVYLTHFDFIENPLTRQILKRPNSHPPSFYLVFFVMSFSIVNGFVDIRQIIKGLSRFLKLLLYLFS